MESEEEYSGQYHVHPYGEINCVVQIDKTAELKGMQGWQGAGWTSPGPGTHHVCMTESKSLFPSVQEVEACTSTLLTQKFSIHRFEEGHLLPCSFFRLGGLRKFVSWSLILPSSLLVVHTISKNYQQIGLILRSLAGTT